jgi:hypothetical protein
LGWYCMGTWKGNLTSMWVFQEVRIAWSWLGRMMVRPPKSHKSVGELRTSRCNEELQVEAADPSAGGTSSVELLELCIVTGKTFPLFKLRFFKAYNCWDIWCKPCGL